MLNIIIYIDIYMSFHYVYAIQNYGNEITRFCFLFMRTSATDNVQDQ